MSAKVDRLRLVLINHSELVTPLREALTAIRDAAEPPVEPLTLDEAQEFFQFLANVGFFSGTVDLGEFDQGP